MSKPFEFITHTADIKIRVFGTSQQELFSNALLGMFSSAHIQGPHITYKNSIAHIAHYTAERTIMVHSPNKILLLVDFLSECLYFSDIYNEAYAQARFIVFEETQLQAHIYGVKISNSSSSGEVEIKAVTYHDLTLEQDANGLWQATIVFDI